MTIECDITLTIAAIGRQNEKLRAIMGDHTAGVELATVSIEIERLEVILADLVAEAQALSRIEQAGGEIEPMLWQREQVKVVELGTKPLHFK